MGFGESWWKKTNSGESSAISRITFELSAVMHAASIRLSAKYYATLPEERTRTQPIR